ncbi:hypothetical protein ABBQ32_006457 [Trebouxia sp. C0010 RCD-2024]
MWRSQKHPHPLGDRSLSARPQASKGDRRGGILSCIQGTQGAAGLCPPETPLEGPCMRKKKVRSIGCMAASFSINSHYQAAFQAWG